MLLSIVQLSLRSVRGAKLLRSADLRSTIKCEYSKWTSRRPVAIANEHELFDTDDTTKSPDDEQRTRKVRRRRSRVSKRKEKDGDTKENEIKESSITEPRYVALDANDKLIRYIVFLNSL